MKDKRIGVLLGGPSSERVISLKTGKAIAAALKRTGYDVVEIDAGADLAERLKAERVEVAFIALHGPLGEDGCVQGLLEVVGIPYTGSGVLASSLSMDKRMTKEILAFHGIPTPAWAEIRSADLDKEMSSLPFDYPAVVKPVAEGSTIGIHIVQEARQMDEAMRDSAQYSDRLLVEQYIAGREVTVGVLDGQALPVIEIVPKTGFFDFERKYTPGETDYLVPAPLDEPLTAECQRLGLETWRAVGAEGVARIDIRIDPQGRCYVLEINTIPGMTETSLIPKAARQVGMSFEQVCERILSTARLKTWRKKEGK